MLLADLLVSISRHFRPPVSMVKDAMESVYIGYLLYHIGSLII